MKKWLQKGIYALIIVTITMVMAMPAYAKDNVKIQIGSAKGKAGEQIEIPVSIKNSNLVAGIDMTICYDSSELEYVDAKAEELTKSGTLYDLNKVSGVASIKYIYANLDGMKKEGKLVTLTFEVLSGDKKNHTVDVKMHTISDADMKDMSYSVEGGRNIKEEKPSGDASENRTQMGEATEDLSNNETENEADSSKTEQKAEEGGNKSAQSSDLGDAATNQVAASVQKKLGIKSDTVGKKTNENLLKETEEVKETDYYTTWLVTIVLLVVVFGGYMTWKKIKKKKEE